MHSSIPINRPGTLLWLALAAVTCAAGQDSGPVLRITTRMVEVHVVVHDKSGKAVAGLTRDDFVLKDRGQPQKITLFSELTKQTAAGPQAPAVPGVYSNGALGEKASPDHATVVLLDQLNTRVSDQNFGRYRLIQFLKHAQLGDKIAILQLTPNSRLQVVADFTSNTERLLRAAAAVKTRASGLKRTSEIDKADSGEGDAVDIASVSATLSGASDLDPLAARKGAEYSTEVRTEHTLHALEVIGRSLAQVPGRKSLIWISSSFPFSMGYASEDIMHWRPLRLNFEQRTALAARVLTDANVAVYPVSAGGMAGVAMGHADDAIPEHFYQGGDPGVDGAALPSSAMQANHSMDALAQATGGRAFYGRNDLDAAIGQALEDAGHVYVLGYEPSHDEWNGKFRPIEVKVNRDGVRVQCRRGYYAWAEESDAQRQNTVAQILESPLDSTGIGLTASLSQQGSRWKVVLVADARQFTLTPKDDLWHGLITAVFVLEDAAGKQVSAKAVSAPLSWNEPELKDKLEHGARFNRLLDAAPSATKLRIVIRDERSGRAGSLTVPLTR